MHIKFNLSRHNSVLSSPSPQITHGTNIIYAVINIIIYVVLRDISFITE